MKSFRISEKGKEKRDVNTGNILFRNNVFHSLPLQKLYDRFFAFINESHLNYKK
jgi:hypothetical protein